MGPWVGLLGTWYNKRGEDSTAIGRGSHMRISKSALIVGLLTAVTVSAARADVIVGTLAFAGSGQFWSPASITTPGTFSYSDAANTDTASFSGNTLTITDVVTT